MLHKPFYPTFIQIYFSNFYVFLHIEIPFIKKKHPVLLEMVLN